MPTDTDTSPLHLRYGGQPPRVAVPLTPAIGLMLRHRSVRSYSDRPLPEGTLEALIAAGQSGSTSSNMQAVSVVVVEDAARRRRLAGPAGQEFLAQAPLLLCFVVDQSRPSRVGAATGEDLWAIPLVDNFLAAVTDATIFAQNVALAAQSLGLGICYIGNLRNDAEGIAAELGLPDRAMVLFGMTVGYETPPVTGIRPRLPQQVVLHRERYSQDHAAEWEALRAYDATVSAHEVSQGRPAMTWTGRHPARYASKDYLGGRIGLRAVLARLGFPLG